MTISLGGTATENTDYTVNTALASIVIPAGVISAEGTLTITPAEDTNVEGEKS